MSQTGTLVTRVFTSRGQLPVQDAFVSVVYHGDEANQRLLSVQNSDRSGNTMPITIDTPILADSQSPDQPTPFALCDLRVEHRGYQLLIIRNVQIFPGIVSVQDLPLIPLSNDGTPEISQVNITPQDL